MKPKFGKSKGEQAMLPDLLFNLNSGVARAASVTAS
jgi:hypothetical protein